MRLPRRVPWASLSELEQVCNWIYTDEGDLDSKVLAINRIVAWKQTTSIPHALDATLGLLSVIVPDSLEKQPLAGAGIHMRQGYAAALLRLVNGLVDPLQFGAYARPIAAIAAQIGLPVWLVELRHAATHEELPSLSVLREGARQAMSWLLHNYFLPQLRPTAEASLRKEPTLRPLTPLLKEYKAFLKTTTRDGSLRKEYAPRITAVLRDVERWVAEAKIAANIEGSVILGWSAAGDDKDVQEEESDVREKWALERLADTLLERGALIPVAKKKRAIQGNLLHPHQGLLAIWSPLLTHLEALHPTLPSTLAERILAHLLAPPPELQRENEDETGLKADPTYDHCAAAWVCWLVDTYDVQDDTENQISSLRRTDVVVELLRGLGPNGSRANIGERKAAGILLKALKVDQPDLETAVAALLPETLDVVSANEWTENDLTTMNDRLKQLRDALQSTDIHDAKALASGMGVMEVDNDNPLDQPTVSLGREPPLPDGWKLVDTSLGWRPEPIGVFVTC